MAQIKMGELNVHTTGSLPLPDTLAPDFSLVGLDLQPVSLDHFRGKNIILNIFPSIDTRVCATSVREFNKHAAALDNTSVLCISKDLPFAFKRFCGAEGIENVISLSDFRDKQFGLAYGVELIDGPFQGLHARAVVVINEEGVVNYTELVPFIGQEPDYQKALSVLVDS